MVKNARPPPQKWPKMRGGYLDRPDSRKIKIMQKNFTWVFLRIFWLGKSNILSFWVTWVDIGDSEIFQFCKKGHFWPKVGKNDCFWAIFKWPWFLGRKYCILSQCLSSFVLVNISQLFYRLQEAPMPIKTSHKRFGVFGGNLESSFILLLIKLVV